MDVTVKAMVEDETHLLKEGYMIKDLKFMNRVSNFMKSERMCFVNYKD